MRSCISGGNAPVSTNEATWPTFIAAPFMFPSTSKICSAVSSWRRSAAALRPSFERVRFAALRGVGARRLAAGEPADLGGAADPARRDAVIGHSITVRCLRRDAVRELRRRERVRARRAPRRAACSTWAASTLLDLGQGGAPRADAEPAGGEGVDLEEVQLLPPLDRPGKLILIGLNYLEHAREAGLEAPEMPTIFAKWSNALRAGRRDRALPPWTEKVDYECEVAFVIGTECKDVPVERCADVIAGYTLLNDLSARDYQFKTPQWMPGKVFDGAAPCGPALVTPDEAGPPDAIEIGTRLNGEVMQSSSTGDLIHSIPCWSSTSRG